MGRKRLLTILAGVTAAVTITAAPAAAQISLPGLGGITLGADECLEIGVDISLLDALKLDPSVCLSEDGLEIEGGVAGIDVGELTEPVEEVTREAAAGVKKATGQTPAPAQPAPDTPPADPPAGGDDDAPAGPDRDRGSDRDRDSDRDDAASDAGTTTGSDVEASGTVREPEVDDPSRRAQLGALRAIRDELAASSPRERGVAGPLSPLGALSSADLDLAAPQVADADSGDTVPGVDAQLAPPVVTDDPYDAILATSSPADDLAQAPLALQLLAAALVLGASAVWTVAARELGRPQHTTA